MKMIQDLRNIMRRCKKMFTEELKNRPTELNNTVERINRRITEAEEQINDLEDRMVEITSAEQNIGGEGKGMKKKKKSLRDLWENIKYINICMIGDPRKEREKEPEKIFEEIIAENFPNMGKDIVN